MCGQRRRAIAGSGHASGLPSYAWALIRAEVSRACCRQASRVETPTDGVGVVVHVAGFSPFSVLENQRSDTNKAAKRNARPRTDGVGVVVHVAGVAAALAPVGARPRGPRPVEAHAQPAGMARRGGARGGGSASAVACPQELSCAARTPGAANRAGWLRGGLPGTLVTRTCCCCSGPRKARNRRRPSRH